MPPTRTSLKGFLATAKKALLAPPAQRPNPLTFVVGNESADMDSLCSALLLAYFRTHTPPHALHIPLSNLPRADLSLRPELNAVFSPAGIKPDDLITLSDLPREDLNPQDTRWLLVDHNVLTGDLAASFSGLVIGCIDHHEDEGIAPSTVVPNQLRLFAKCGSCMSLVIDQCKSVWDQLSPPSPPPLPPVTPVESRGQTDPNCCDDGTPASQCDAALARIALAPILLDTSNLTSAVKTTEWDVRAAELALSRLRAAKGDSEFDPAAFHAELARLKEHMAGLPYRDVLRKDYKQWGDAGLNVGVSAVAQGFEYVLTEVGEKRKEDFLQALKGWAAEQRLDVAAVMTVSRPGGVFTRELLVWGLNAAGVKVARQFVGKYGEVLGLETWKGGELDGRGEGEGEWRVCWSQRNIEHSRKQVAPMLRDAMKDSSRL